MILLSRRLGVLALVAATAACSDPSRAVDAPAGAAANAPTSAAANAPASAPAGPADEVRKFTGAPTKVAWVQSDGSDPFAAGNQLVLMGLSTEDGKGERVILGTRQSYVKPLLTPRGDRIVFSTRPQDGGPEMFVVNWDGIGAETARKGLRARGLGRSDGRQCLGVRRHRQQRQELRLRRPCCAFRSTLRRKRELVWNKTLVSADTFQRLGRRPVRRGTLSLAPRRRRRTAEQVPGTLGDGCWTAMTTARGPLLWYFDGAHRNVTMVDVDTSKRWMVNINRRRDSRTPRSTIPRWTNHPRFLALTGPYNQGGANQVRSGGKQSEVYLGRFSADFSRIEAWARVTTTPAAIRIQTSGSTATRARIRCRPAAPSDRDCCGGAGYRKAWKSRQPTRARRRTSSSRTRARSRRRNRSCPTGTRWSSTSTKS